MFLDSMGLLNIKKLVNTGGNNNLNILHKMAVAHMNLMILYQEKFQDIQKLRDQSMEKRKVCNETRFKIWKI